MKSDFKQPGLFEYYGIVLEGKSNNVVSLFPKCPLKKLDGERIATKWQKYADIGVRFEEDIENLKILASLETRHIFYIPRIYRVIQFCKKYDEKFIAYSSKYLECSKFDVLELTRIIDDSDLFLVNKIISSFLSPSENCGERAGEIFFR